MINPWNLCEIERKSLMLGIAVLQHPISWTTSGYPPRSSSKLDVDKKQE
jgi:hypothetical protein